jgi:hypothetical protein
MSVDPETGYYIGLGIILVAAAGLVVYARLFWIDRSDRGPDKHKH